MARGDEVRGRVLTAVEELVLGGDGAPTFDAISARAGVSKGGVLHHFPDRQALVAGLAQRAITLTDEAMTAAAQNRQAARTWLELSVGQGPDLRAARALLSLLRVEAGGRMELPAHTSAQIEDSQLRWQEMITAELGDPVQAAVVRLVGDGLFAAALAGTLPGPDELEAVADRLLGPSTGAPR